MLCQDSKNYYINAKDARTADMKGRAGVYIYYFPDENNTMELSYVGSTLDFNRRHNEHLNDLKSRTHTNYKLQSVYNKYGLGKMGYKELEEMSFPESYCTSIKRLYLEGRELYWSELLGSRLMLVKPGSNKSFDLKERKFKKTFVLQVDSELNILRVFEGLRDAERETGVYATAISKVASLKQHSAKGLFFRYINTLDSSFIKASKGNPLKGMKRYYNRIPVVGYDLKGNLIRSYSCIIEAAQDLNITKTNIGRCCRKERSCVGNYIFRFKDDTSQVLPVRNIRKPISIDCYKEDRFYKTFKSAGQAEEVLGIKRQTIHFYLKNGKSYDSFSFKLVTDEV